MAKSLIGLDIGTNNVKAVELIESGKDVIVKHVGFAPIEAIPELTNEEDRHKAIIKAIKAALPAGSLKSKKVATALSGKSVITRTVSLPKGPVLRLPREEVKRMIITEIEAEIPFPVEEAVLDYFIIDDLATLKEDKVRMMVAVVPKTEIDKNMALMKEIGIEQESIDIVPFALMRGISVLKARLNVETIGIIELGAATSEVVVAKAGEMLFTRNIPLGGNLLTRVIQDILNLDYAKAENSKVKEGLPQTVTPQFERIATEVRNSLSYFQLQEHKKIDLTFICGGGGKLKEVLQYLKEKIDIPLEIANPFENVKNAMKNIPADFLADIAPYLIVAIGLAIKQKKTEKRINLLPEEFRKEGVSFKMIYAAASVATTMVVILIYLLLGYKVKQMTLKIDEMTKAMSNLQYVVVKTQEAKKLSDETKRLEDVVKNIYKISPPYAQVLDELAMAMPSSVWLREIDITGDQVEAAALAAKNVKPGTAPKKESTTGPAPLKMIVVGSSLKTQGVAAFMINLRTYPHFINFDLTGARLTNYGKEEGVAWSFECNLLKELPKVDDKTKTAEVKK